MHWYNGGIAEAITVSKSKGAVFVVYIQGKDEKSEHITGLINSEEIGSKLGSDKFVAIKLEANSVPHQQFGEFYKQTPVPSLYFIGKNGSPIKIITEAADSSSLSKELDSVLELAEISPIVQSPVQNAALSSQSFISAEQSTSQKPPNVVCENGVCTLQRDPVLAQTSEVPAAGNQTEASAEEKIERAKQLLEAKRLLKEQEEKEKEKQKELERRKMGQDVQKMKKRQEDQELKQFKEDMEREKRLEKEAKDSVLAQIARDKLERAAKFKPAASSNREVPPAVPSTSKSDSNTARLQFKMPDGTSKTENFASTDKLVSVYNFVKANMAVGSEKFSLSTAFPRKQLTEEHHQHTLVELQLTPNAVILVLPLNHGTVSNNQGGSGGLMAYLWWFMTPFLGVFDFIKMFLGIGGGTESSEESSNSSGGSYSGGNRSNSVVHISSKYDLENRLKSARSKLVVIDFFATWCGPCKMIAPEFERMAKDFPTVVFLKVDVDQNGDISRDYGVSAMPTFVFLKNRREVSRVQGADSYNIRSTIQRYK